MLRPIDDGDLDYLFEIHSDPQAAAMADVPIRERAAFDAHWAQIRANPQGLVRAIVEGGALVGYITSWTEGGRRLVGYWIGREYWGRGYASSALQAFLALLEDRPLYALVVPNNVASVRVLEKAGFSVARRGAAELEFVFP